MGVYDKMEFHLKCRDCGATDQIIFLDQGVGWGFPEWVVTGMASQFNVGNLSKFIIWPSLPNNLFRM